MTPLCEHPDLPRLLRRHLAEGQADRHWRRWLEPQLTYGRHGGPARSDARRAAVAIVLYQEDSRWHVPLTVRPAGLRSHGGQVSFPGGALEANENSREAAHRELVEELWADLPCAQVHVDWLAPLAPLLVYVSNVMVEPWVGVLRERHEWRPQPEEVERVLALPLEQLLEGSPGDSISIRRGSLEFSAPRLVVDGDDVWGTTAVLLGELRGWLLQVAREEAAA